MKKKRETSNAKQTTKGKAKQTRETVEGEALSEAALDQVSGGINIPLPTGPTSSLNLKGTQVPGPGGVLPLGGKQPLQSNTWGCCIAI